METIAEDVFNQSSEFGGFDAYSTDPLLKTIGDHLPPPVTQEFPPFGRAVTAGEAQDAAHLANVNAPNPSRKAKKTRDCLAVHRTSALAS